MGCWIGAQSIFGLGFEFSKRVLNIARGWVEVALGGVCLCPTVCGFSFSFRLHFLLMLTVSGSPAYPAYCCAFLARCDSYAIIVYPALMDVLLLVASSCSIVIGAWMLRLTGTTGISSIGWPTPSYSLLPLTLYMRVSE
jgi:hypothetical protein